MKRLFLIATACLLVLVMAIVLVAALTLVSKIRRADGVARVQEMGGQVAIEWVGYPQFTTVCWIAFDQSEFDERQLDELIEALKQIGVRRYVISQGNPTTIDETVMQRMWREVGNIRFGYHERFKHPSPAGDFD